MNAGEKKQLDFQQREQIVDENNIWKPLFLENSFQDCQIRKNLVQMAYAYDFHKVANVEPVVICQWHYSMGVFFQVPRMAEVI